MDLAVPLVRQLSILQLRLRHLDIQPLGRVERFKRSRLPVELGGFLYFLVALQQRTYGRT